MKVRRVDFSPDEWIGGTIALSNAERGLYITACAMIYSKGKSIKVGDLFAACTDHGNSLKSQLSSLVDKGKLIRNGDEIDQKRARKELQKAAKRSRIGRQNVNERWKNNEIADKAVLPLGNANHQPSTINHQPSKNHPPAPPTGGMRSTKAEFEEWWQAYPRKVGKDAAARKYLAARRVADAETLLAGARRYGLAVAEKDKEFIAHPSTWLHGGRWKDELENGTDREQRDRPTGPPPPLNLPH